MNSVRRDAKSREMAHTCGASARTCDLHGPRCICPDHTTALYPAKLNPLKTWALHRPGTGTGTGQGAEAELLLTKGQERLEQPVMGR